jgi:hypothetical protein
MSCFPDLVGYDILQVTPVQTFRENLVVFDCMFDISILENQTNTLIRNFGKPVARRHILPERKRRLHRR